MAVIIAKNTTGGPIELADIGITIPSSSQRNLTDEWSLDEIDASIELRDNVTTGDIVINNGVEDLDVSNSLDHIRVITMWEETDTLSDFSHDDLADIVVDPNAVDDHDNRYYTQIDLNNSGGSEVHWNNITNIPSFGAPTWVENVIARIEEQSASGPGSPTTGMFYIDTDDNHLYKWSGSVWIDQGAPNSGDRVIDKTNEGIYEYQDGTTLSWIQQPGPEYLWGLLIGDDGDGKPAQYVYDSTTWIKIGDVDWGSPFVGRVVFEFGRDRDKLNNQWLRGALHSASNLGGPRMIQSSRVVAMAVQCRNAGNANFHLRKNGVSSNLATLSISGVAGNHNKTMSVNLAEGDWIGVYMEVVSGTIDRPHVTVYVV